MEQHENTSSKSNKSSLYDSMIFALATRPPIGPGGGSGKPPSAPSEIVANWVAKNSVLPVSTASVGIMIVGAGLIGMGGVAAYHKIYE